MKEMIQTEEDLLNMLDSLLRDPSEFWESFYTDRDKNIPFFANKPDENLVSYFERDILAPCHVLELGSGPGRNAIYFAENGCTVDAIDLSITSIEWAKERALEKQVGVNFMHDNLFDVKLEESAYDVIYDSGCFTISRRIEEDSISI